MPYSARALGQQGLRLRSRRVRSIRSQRLSAQHVVALVLAVGLTAFVGVSVADSELSLNQPSLANTATVDRVYLDALLPIHSRLMQTVLRTGLAASSLGDNATPEIQADLETNLDRYRRIEAEVLALDPPGDLRESHQTYLGAIRLFERSTVEMLKVYDDGQPDHLSAAAPLSLEGMARMRALSDRFWPR